MENRVFLPVNYISLKASLIKGVNYLMHFVYVLKGLQKGTSQEAKTEARETGGFYWSEYFRDRKQ